MDRSESLLTNNCHDLEAEADLHMEDVTVKSNSVPKRPIAIDSFVKEALISTTESGHLDCGIKTSKIKSVRIYRNSMCSPRKSRPRCGEISDTIDSARK